MNRKLILSLAITICLLAVAGCKDASDSTQSEATGQEVTSESFNATPVQHADVNGVILGYREFGSGKRKPLLMITGFGDIMDNWNKEFIGILAKKYHVYTYDHRDMGYSTKYIPDNATKPEPSISQYADDAAALMIKLGHKSMHVYGVSMGSSISQQLVIDHPHCVRKLVLSSNSYIVNNVITPDLFTMVTKILQDNSVSEGIHRQAQAILGWAGCWAGLAGIDKDKDVMLLVGTNDVLTPDSISVEMSRQIFGSWLVRFKGISHAGSNFAPVAYGQCVLTFLGVDESPELVRT